MADLHPSCVVIVATIRALKMHGGVAKADLNQENVEALLKGITNLDKHIENIKKYHLPYVVAINRFGSDTENEIKALENWSKENNHPVALSEVFAKGGDGGIELAKKVVEEITLRDGSKDFAPIYDENDTIENKISTICKEIYGADGVEFTTAAKRQIATLNENGWNNLPICIAKTQYSLSDSPLLLGRASNFKVTIRELKPSIGAGFIVALSGDIMTMPGLPKKPAANNMDVIDGKTVGLF
jgi:formate--tetrahydrofolate ligase